MSVDTAAKLRTPNLFNDLNEKKIMKPFVDNKVRWNGKNFIVRIFKMNKIRNNEQLAFVKYKYFRTHFE